MGPVHGQAEAIVHWRGVLPFVRGSDAAQRERARWELEVSRQSRSVGAVFEGFRAGLSRKQLLDSVEGPISSEILSIIDYVDSARSRWQQPRPLRDPSVSVVIPHFNHQHFLNDALQGFVDQTEPPDEVIVVDDLSSDRESVKAICSRYERRLALTLLLPDTKLHSGGARQLGAEASKHEIILMCDADDVPHFERVKFVKELYRMFPDACHVTTGFLRFQGPFMNILRGFSSAEFTGALVRPDEIFSEMRTTFVEQRFSVPYSWGRRWGSYGVSRRFGTHGGHPAYRKVAGRAIKWPTPDSFTFTRFEDYEFNLFLLLVGRRSYHIDLPLLYYRQGTSTNMVTYQ